MRLRSALFLTTLFFLCFTVAAWPARIPDQGTPRDARPAPDTQSVSGKISSIGDAAFTLEVAKDQEVNTIHFLVDDQTKAQGRLTVGARATVEYHLDGGNYIAVRVVVRQARR